jgi:pyruvate dehydrogenase E2 component (dihydrolipoyllysine-residue acetyltransferase)
MNVLMPQLGETVAEGKVTKWFKSAGDAVQPGDNLFEIETDKVSMEVPATEAGVLSEIRVQEGETAPVGAIVGVIGGATGAGQAQAPRARPANEAPRSAPTAAATPPATARELQSAHAGAAQPIKLDPFFEVRTPEHNFGPARLSGGVTVTPLARRLAAETGIDLSRLRGSGPHGRIVARDIETAPPAPSAAPPAAVVAAAPAGPSTEQVKPLYDPANYEEVMLDGMRRTIAARLLQAKQTIPHFYVTADVEIDRLKALREEVNAAAPKDRDGNPLFKLSLNDFVIRALALALQRVPAANAVWAGDRILRFKRADIGVAVAIEGGLITPVVRSADTKSVSAISAEMKDLAARARAKKLKPHEYQGGSAAVSNLGMYGVREFAAIINPPHATILAVGAARRQAVEKTDGGVAFASMLTATLSCDHRVVDGALGAELLAAFKSYVEQPVTALV